MSEVKVSAITIRKNETGEAKRLPQEWSWHDSGDNEWTDLLYYREGNGGCDCNRSIWFGDAEVGNAHCGDIAYDILKLELSDGRVFEDFDTLNDREKSGDAS